MGLKPPPPGACDTGPGRLPKFLAGEPGVVALPRVAPRLTGKVEFNTELAGCPCDMGPMPDSGSICGNRTLRSILPPEVSI